MKRFFIAAAVAAAAGLFAPAEASAQGPLRRMVFGVASARAVSASTSRDCQQRQSFAPVRNAVAYVQQNQPVRTAIRNAAPHYYQNVPMGIEEKAQWLVRNQVSGHVGAIPPGLFEGTSTNCSTPQEAVASTCKPVNGGELVNSFWVRQPNGLYAAVNHYKPYPSPSAVVLSGPGTPVTIPATGVAHIPERTVWRPTAEVQTATCNGPTCVPSRAAILTGR